MDSGRLLAVLEEIIADAKSLRSDALGMAELAEKQSLVGIVREQRNG